MDSLIEETHARQIDCRGLSCPSPVLRAKEAIESDGLDELSIMVDNKAAKQNMSRFLESQGFQITVSQEGTDFSITGKKSEKNSLCELMVEGHKAPEKSKIMIMVTSDRIGHGDDYLGAQLMTNFLGTLKEMGDELWRLVFVNNGVKLTITDSDVLPILKGLQEEGVQLLVCGTCLTHFDILEKKQVGETTNMLDIITAMQVADKVIHI